MNEQLFDAMLRTALEEALEEDCREAPAEQKHTGHTSLRQRRRMRRMLASRLYRRVRFSSACWKGSIPSSV